MKDWETQFEERKQEAGRSRALLATTLVHAIRDYINGDVDADCWIFDDVTEESVDELSRMTFVSVCSALELDPKNLRNKLIHASLEELKSIKKQLRRPRASGDEGDGV